MYLWNPKSEVITWIQKKRVDLRAKNLKKPEKHRVVDAEIVLTAETALAVPEAFLIQL